MPYVFDCPICLRQKLFHIALYLQCMHAINVFRFLSHFVISTIVQSDGIVWIRAVCMCVCMWHASSQYAYSIRHNPKYNSLFIEPNIKWTTFNGPNICDIFSAEPAISFKLPSSNYFLSYFSVVVRLFLIVLSLVLCVCISHAAPNIVRLAINVIRFM